MREKTRVESREKWRKTIACAVWLYDFSQLTSRDFIPLGACPNGEMGRESPFTFAEEITCSRTCCFW